MIYAVIQIYFDWILGIWRPKNNITIQSLHTTRTSRAGVQVEHDHPRFQYRKLEASVLPSSGMESQLSVCFQWAVEHYPVDQ